MLFNQLQKGVINYTYGYDSEAQTNQVSEVTCSPSMITLHCTHALHDLCWISSDNIHIARVDVNASHNEVYAEIYYVCTSM